MRHFFPAVLASLEFYLLLCFCVSAVKKSLVRKTSFYGFVSRMPLMIAFRHADLDDE
jgi:hypothetical protein